MPSDEKIEKFRNEILTLSTKTGMLLPVHEVQSFVGLHEFMSRFLKDGRRYCNSRYRCLRIGVKTELPFGIIRKELIKDGTTVLRLVSERELPTIVRDPVFVHPGRYGANSDPSGSGVALERGWGATFQGSRAQGVCPAEVRGPIAAGYVFISALELLTVSICLHIGEVQGAIPQNRRIVLRNDNESACMVGNTGRAFYAPMLAALRVLQKVQERVGVEVWLHHIEGERNEIADNLSGGREAKGILGLEYLWPVPATVPHPKELEGWHREIVRSGKHDAMRLRRSGRDD